LSIDALPENIHEIRSELIHSTSQQVTPK